MSFFKEQQYQGSAGDTLFGNGILGAFGLFNKTRPLPQYQDPAYPQYIQNFDPNTMSMQPYAQGLTAGIMPDQRGMNQYRSEALRTGPSAWSGLARAQLSKDEANQRNMLAGQAASGAAGARSQLAMRGGLRGGAAERLATQGNRAQMMGAQELAGQSMSNRAKISVQDEGNRINMLKGLPGIEIDQLRPQQWSAEQQLRARDTDMQRYIQENQARNLYGMNWYNEQMQGNQANRNADVMLANAPKDKGLLGNIFGGIF